MAGLLEMLNREMRIRNYSPRTIKAYAGIAKDLYRFTRRPLKTLSAIEVKEDDDTHCKVC